MGKRRGAGGGFEDQYGEGGAPQDKEVHSGFSGKSNKGGGTAGGSRKGTDLSFQRQVPKFLQQYAHLLGKTLQDEEEPVLVNEGEDGKEEESEEQEEALEANALRRAMAENPELAKEFESQLEARLRQAEATEEKERGNAAFGKKKYEEAVKSFTRCMELDPSNEVYPSNRSAAYAAQGQWQAALDDAKRCVGLKPAWAKGWARLGAASMGLQLYSDAKEAYERALKLEPDDQSLQKAYEKAQVMEYQQIREGKHTFKKMKKASGAAPSGQGVPAAPAPAPGEGGQGGSAAAAATGPEAAAAKPESSGAGKVAANKKLLSFGADDEEEAQ